jgi:hypothetical protein
MKKLLFLMVVGFGGTMLVKGGHVTITPDNQVRVAGYPLPLPDAVQNSPILGMIGGMMRLQAPVQAGVADPRYAVAQPARPPVPTISSVNGTYNANAPSAPAPGVGPAGIADTFNSVAKALK